MSNAEIPQAIKALFPETPYELPPWDEIKVFVRKGATDHERRLTFNRPERIPSSVLIQHGFAIDGNQAVCALAGRYSESEDDAVAGRYSEGKKVWAYTYPTFKPENETDTYRSGVDCPWEDADSLPEALRQTQKALISFLKQFRYRVEFA